MPLASLFRRNPHRAAAHALYGAIVARARDPAFFLALSVPDTLDGRFELIALHAFLVLNRLKADHAATAALAQELFDTMFADLDRGLREMGAGDLGVGRRVKNMAKGFYGRIVAYEQGLAASDDVLAAALRRNLYGTVIPPEDSAAAVARYTRREAAALAAQPVSELLSGRVKFELEVSENETFS
ncbi:MAG TPA: ubiquinol-cytochrome C chaperone family protein [Stellaceae bacterium]|nr:ubiquinol-cytochrome C chaperone family protein [Stellaceae bacterium]